MPTHTDAQGFRHSARAAHTLPLHALGLILIGQHLPVRFDLLALQVADLFKQVGQPVLVHRSRPMIAAGYGLRPIATRLAEVRT
jgi:hypothetical protein